ncbi:MAG: lipopolysaccharide biosynthesis protein RfbH [Actinomycetota bacterium]
MSGESPSEMRAEILALVARFASAQFEQSEFIPGESAVPVSGRVFDRSEVVTLVDAALDFWLTTGRFAAQFEAAFAGLLGRRHAILCNSGSSANLLALSALTSPKLGERRLRPGDEVITVAAGFPTTVNPVVQNGLVPVFVDVEPLERGTYNIDVRALEAAVSSRTRAIMVAHTLGNPFRVNDVLGFAEANELWFVEDNCDALGSEFGGHLTGTFGDLATSSFYPAHHITMGEGGCVVTDRPLLKTLVESFRDWGRDCWCEPGAENTCKKRFGWGLSSLPKGFDHKYTFSHVGYNLKLTDMQAAVGVAQLEKLSQFTADRRANFEFLHSELVGLEDAIILPTATPGAEPSWFGFPVAIRTRAGLSREKVVAYLEASNVKTRMIFAGNLTRQPAYEGVPYRVAGSLENTDAVMDHAFWVGLYPGLTEKMLMHTAKTLREAVGAR